MKKALSIIGFALATLFFALPLQAQPRGQGGGRGAQAPTPAQMEAKLKEIRGRVMREHVGLSEDKAREVEAVFERFAPESRKIEKQVHDSKARLRKLIASDSNDQKAFAEALETQRRARMAMMTLRDREFQAIKKILQPKQQAKLLFALKKMQRRVKEEMKKRSRQTERRERQGRGKGAGAGAGAGAGDGDDADDTW